VEVCEFNHNSQIENCGIGAWEQNGTFMVAYNKSGFFIRGSETAENSKEKNKTVSIIAVVSNTLKYLHAMNNFFRIGLSSLLFMGCSKKRRTIVWQIVF
jgi:hypothetical protein